MSYYLAGVRLCDGCSEKVGLAKRAHKDRVRMKAKPRLQAKADDKAARLARLREIREALLAETGGRCCVCGSFIDAAAMECHHLIGGGQRRSHESALTMAPLCYGCHQGDGHNNEKTVRLLLAWCELTERTEAAAALRRRLNKIEEARR